MRDHYYCCTHLFIHIFFFIFIHTCLESQLPLKLRTIWNRLNFFLCSRNVEQRNIAKPFQAIWRRILRSKIIERKNGIDNFKFKFKYMYISKVWVVSKFVNAKQLAHLPIPLTKHFDENESENAIFRSHD